MVYLFAVVRHSLNTSMLFFLDVEQFLSGTKDILSPLVKRFSGADIMEKLSGSILAMAARQLVAHHYLSISISVSISLSLSLSLSLYLFIYPVINVSVYMYILYFCMYVYKSVFCVLL